jgi:amino acid adenylation domain-containing protein
LRQFLSRRLPDYMLPSAFVLLDALPLTPNGKLDQRALPAPDTARPAFENAFIAPRTAAEQTLATIWARVLKREQIGIHDNFFALGGDSIRGIEVVAATQAAGLAITVQHLFLHQTIAQLATVAEPESPDAAAAAPLADKPFSLISAADRAQLPDDVEDAYPLTLLQAGMVFHSQLHPDAGVYHDIFSFHLRGQLDLDVFDQVVQQVIDRHQALRIAFDMQRYQQPLQLVYRHAPVAVGVDDLQALDPAAQEQALERWMERERRHAFELERPPLARFMFHRRSRASFQFSFSFHHAILDGWSVALLLTELFQRYMAQLHGQPEPAPPLQASFGSFVALEQAARSASDQREFWQRKLGDHPPLSLPPAPPAPEPYSGPRQALIEPAVALGLQQLAAELSVPLRSVLLTAHLAVLRLLSGQRDVITGLVTNGRPETLDGERILGLFLNSVPFQLRVGRQSWRELIAATFAAEQELLPYRRYPLAQMQRDQGGRPLFETLFNFVHFHVYQQLQNVPGLQLVGEQVFAKTNFALDVTFSVSPASAQIALLLDYNERIGPQRAGALLDAYVGVLQQIATEPASRYSAARLLPAAERRLLLSYGRRTPIDQAEACLHELIAAQAARTPDALAVVYEQQTLSYAALDRRANQLAHQLRALGVGPETIVGVCLQRSLDLVVALLAVLKAGGAYLPLDPAYPAERLQFMLQDSAAAVLITHETLAPLAVEQIGLLQLDRDAAAIERQPATAPPVVVDPAHPAYLLYTSGSTGQPKGALISHAAIVNHMQWMQARFPLTAADRVVQKTPFSFDASVWEFYAPLLAGARLVLARPGGHQDPAYLAELIATEQITILQMVPSLLRLLLDEPLLHECACLRRLFCGGEALPVDLVRRAQALLPATAIINVYGPTETTIEATFWECPPVAADATISIGRPITNAYVAVLDDDLEPTPIGVAGELYIGGAGLARGYLNRPALTAEKFLPDPWSAQPGARLYRTGDLARYLPDGDLEYLGRRDTQIKLRGLRIELGEIESALRQHPAVRDAAVLVRADGTSGKRLTAYIVPGVRGQESGVREESSEPSALAQRAPLQPSALRQFLAQRLPDYMLPAAFVELDALPLTPSGKLDQRALAQHAITRPQRPTKQLRPPRDEIELRLVQLWEELLDTRPIGVHDHFAELGGDSLRAVRLRALIEQRFGQALPLTAIFQASTVAELALLLREAQPDHPWSPLVALQPHGHRPPLFLVHPGGGTVLCYADLTRRLGPDQPVYAFQSRGLEPDQTPHTTIEAMASDYLAALRQVQPHGPYHIGGWSLGGAVAYELARQLDAAGDAAQLVLIDSYLTAPHEPEPDALALLIGFVRDLGAQLGRTLALPLDTIAALPAAERLRFVLDHAQQQGLTADVGPDQLQRLAAVFEANLRAQLRYQPQPCATPIVQLRAAESQPDPAARSWQTLSPHVETMTLPGNHYTLLREPHVALLAERIEARLSAQTETRSARE